MKQRPCPAALRDVQTRWRPRPRTASEPQPCHVLAACSRRLCACLADWFADLRIASAPHSLSDLSRLEAVSGCHWLAAADRERPKLTVATDRCPYVLDWPHLIPRSAPARHILGYHIRSPPRSNAALSPAPRCDSPHRPPAPAQAALPCVRCSKRVIDLCSDRCGSGACGRSFEDNANSRADSHAARAP